MSQPDKTAAVSKATLGGVSPGEQVRADTDVEASRRDPINHAARELVNALIDNRWSLEAAAVVVALRRLYETVEGKDVDAMFASWRLRGRIASGG